MIFNAEPETRHTTQPIVTGGSVIALTFKGGVVIATDTLCSYGSMATFKNVEKIVKVSSNTVIASSGEYSDFQEVTKQLSKIQRESLQYDDGVKPSPRDYGNYLARQAYKRRCKINPLYLQNVVAGHHNGESYLAIVDLYGTYIESKFATTGFAGYFCKAIISNYWNENGTEQEAKQVIEECFKVLFCRDCRAHDVIQLAVVDQDGVRIEQPKRIETRWDFAGFKNRANEILHTQ